MITMHPLGFIVLLVILLFVGFALFAGDISHRPTRIAARLLGLVFLVLVLLGIVAWAFLLIDFSLG